MNTVVAIIGIIAVLLFAAFIVKVILPAALTLAVGLIILYLFHRFIAKRNLPK